MLLCVVGFFGYLGMRLVPMYIEYMGVVRAMKQLQSEPNSRNLSPEEVRRNLYFKFNTQYVDEAAIPPQAIQVKRENNVSTLRIKYERRVPWIHNIELLATFDKSVRLDGTDG
ncbi:DUF4845 domain-containing protein [Dokdonella sp.]|uniref:DUF4845 domain-containing protein n=1 Tax=Dokdonella sp. TaxID=2291710 RepID=UPI0035291B94